MRFGVLLVAVCLPACAQFEMQKSGVTSSLRGVHAVSADVAWASGSAGTVIRTLDGGATWLRCATPEGGEKLDFRGVQGLSAQTAVVMSSGTGDLSRLYKTTDGCKTWKLVFHDPDANGFFDAIRRVTDKQMYVLGDPVAGKFAMFFTDDAGENWYIADDPGRESDQGDGAYAAGNSALTAVGPYLLFGTGGTGTPKVYFTAAKCVPPPANPTAPAVNCTIVWNHAEVPLAGGSAAAGVFSLAARMRTNQNGTSKVTVVAVGGRYDKPEVAAGTAATSGDGGRTWTAAQTPPGGYRSAVAFDSARQTWMAVGPTGTDVSLDDGRNWKAELPEAGDAADADKEWNAISLPYVVGSKGRVGKMRVKRQGGNGKRD